MRGRESSAIFGGVAKPDPQKVFDEMDELRAARSRVRELEEAPPSDESEDPSRWESEWSNCT